MTEGMNREALIAAVLLASTEEQCNHAKSLIIVWMQEHPRDFGMLDAGEQVAMILDSYAQEALASAQAV